MKIQQAVSLKAAHTFGMDVQAAEFARFETEAELCALLDLQHPTRYLLGGGSNVLFTDNWPGLMLQNGILGREVVEETEDTVLLKAGGGEVWHHLVLWTLDRNWGGLENLSLIPGSVGAAPIQNIGAYGVELKDVFEYLEAIDLQSKERLFFSKADCRFGYRDSIFKQTLKGKVCITQVYLRLQKKPEVQTHYGAIRQTLQAWGIAEPTIQEVSKAVIHIRQQKLPDPNVLGNAGSFFKNPVIGRRQFLALQAQYPDIVFYPQEDDQVKIPAGWLIEQAGWKGKRVGNTGSHAQQALVLVNYGGATGQEVYALAQAIIESIRQQFGVELHPEVNIV